MSWAELLQGIGLYENSVAEGDARERVCVHRSLGRVDGGFLVGLHAGLHKGQHESIHAGCSDRSVARVGPCANEGLDVRDPRQGGFLGEKKSDVGEQPAREERDGGPGCQGGEG